MRCSRTAASQHSGSTSGVAAVTATGRSCRGAAGAQPRRRHGRTRHLVALPAGRYDAATSVSSKAEALLQQLATQQSGPGAVTPTPLATPTSAAVEAISNQSAAAAAPSATKVAGSILEQLQQQPGSLLAQLQSPQLEALTPPQVDWQALQSKVNGLQPQLDQLQSKVSDMQPQLDQLQPDWQQLQPHWGSQLAQQALGAAQQALHVGPNSSSSWGDAAGPIRDALSSAVQQVQVPDIHLPSVQLPQLSAPELPHLDLSAPSFQLPSPQALLQAATSAATSAVSGAEQLAGSAVSGAGQLPGQLAAATGGQVEVAPHFGSQVVASWLSQLATWLQQLAEAPLVAASGAVGVGGLPLGEVVAQWRSAATALAASLPHPSLPPAAAAAAANLTAAAASLTAVPLTLTADAGAALSGLGDAFSQLQEQGMGGYSFATLALVAAGAAAAIAASVPASREPEEPQDGLKLSHEYDPNLVAAYFEARPLMVAQRAAQLAAEATSFGSVLALDLATGTLQANEVERAQQLRAAIERLGPAYVKVAQALSTRVDLLTPAYFEQIQLLQDRVPPFPCEDAKKVMAAAFGRPVDQVLSQLSEKPVAAASLGQVYRGRLSPALGGTEVAIKVQRPDVLDTVCLDLYLMRRLAVTIQTVVPEVTTDWAGLIDNWAVRFLHEMDYEREAANAGVFKGQMAEAGVTGVVTAPVVSELSSDVVLTTEWITGEKLSESNAADVRELCNTLLNAYLIQLLDTGFLHADPHPGNLIRTPDGKICVLDFGLVTQVTPEQRIALVEYIAHLVTQDWENVARDLQTLGFIPEEAGDPVALGIVPPLGSILSQLSGGGGATKLNIDAVMSELETLGRSYPFQIPPFFALILRAFSVIEGIALRVDPDYSIVMECFPYIARRLLADDDPRVRKALRDVLYGDKQRLDVERLMRLADAFSAFTTDGLAEGGALPAAAAAAPVGLSNGSSTAMGSSSSSSSSVWSGSTPTPVAPRRQQPAAAPASASTSSSSSRERLSPAAKEALLLVFAPQGSYMQELLVEELVAAVDALSREAASELLRRVLGSAPAVVALSSIEALGPLRPLVLPVPTPLELLTKLVPAVAVGPEDEEALGTLRGVFQLLQRVAPSAPLPPGFGPTPTGGGSPLAAAAEAVVSAAQVASELRPILPELLPGLAHTGELFVRTFVRRAALRVAETASVGEEYDQAMAAVGFMPWGLPNAAAGGLRGDMPGGMGGGLPSSGNQFGYAGVSYQQQQQVEEAFRMAAGNPSSSSSSSSRRAGVQTADWAVRQSARVRAARNRRRGAKPNDNNTSSGSAASGQSTQNVSAGQQAPGGEGYAQLPSAGQVVTALLAAPLLMVFTPLALLSQHQQYEAQRRDSKWL